MELSLFTCWQTTPLWLRDVADPFTTLHKVEIDAFHQHVKDALENNCIYVYGQPVCNGYFWEMARWPLYKGAAYWQTSKNHVKIITLSHFVNNNN